MAPTAAPAGRERPAAESKTAGRRIVGAAAALGLAVAALAGGSGRAAPLARPAHDGGYVLVDSWPMPVAPRLPIDVALSPAGHLYVADGRDNAVFHYGPSGARIETISWPSLLPPDAQVAFVPVAVVADGERGELHILWRRYAVEPDFRPDGLLRDVRRLDNPGPEQTDYLGPPKWVGNDAALVGLEDAALHRPSGSLFLLGGGDIVRLRSNGTIDQRFTLPPPDRGATRLAVLADGRIVVARPADKALALYGADGAAGGILTVLDDAPAALAVGQDGSLHVLVRSRDAFDPGQTLVVSLAENGTVLQRRAAAALGAPPLPALPWRWSLDAPANDHFALTSGDEHFTVTVRRPGGLRPPPLVGAPVTAVWTPAPAPFAADEDLVVTQSPEGEVYALDRRDDRIVAFAPDGAWRFVADTPSDALDLAVGPGGAEDLFITTAGGDVIRLDPGGPGGALWRVPCDCHLGGRIATGGGAVFVSQPRARRIRVFNALNGAVERDHSLAGTALWPYDVTWQSGYVYAADLIETRIQSFPPPPLSMAQFTAGLLAGPRRLSPGQVSGDGEVAIDALAAVMADGWVELHDPNGTNLLARFRPALADETPLFPSDIAAGRDVVYLADAARRAVHVFGAGSGIPRTPEVPTATPTPAGASCEVSGDKRAEPATVVEGESAQVTLSLRARCPDRARLVGADIVLVIDRSASMRGAPLEAARGAARSFAELLDVRIHRLGLTSFADEATMDYGLTDDVATVIDHLEALEAGGGTNISAGLARAGDNLSRFGRVEALPVLVVLTDGRQNPDTPDPVQAAVGLRARGVQIFAIGLGPNIDAAALGGIAGAADRVFVAPAPSDLFPIYRQVLRVVVDSLAGNVTIDDALSDGVTLVDGSVSPPARPLGRRLSWGRSILPANGITMTYLVRPTGRGCMPTNERAAAEYTDADGVRRTFVFPVPTVCVVAPSPTPTPSPTATPEPTPVPAPIYLPVTYRNFCKPVAAGVDVVLLIDTSDSMRGAKLEQAKRAARIFVGELSLDTGDQAAIVGFDGEARIGAQLTRDRAVLEAAIDGLASGSGTRIDRALQAAERELRSPRHAAGHRAAAVLLSDGRQSGPTSIVESAAGQLRAIPALLFAIGLGDEADAALLRRITGDARRTFFAPAPEQLEGIYRTIAEVIPCP